MDNPLRQPSGQALDHSRGPSPSGAGLRSGPGDQPASAAAEVRRDISSTACLRLESIGLAPITARSLGRLTPRPYLPQTKTGHTGQYCAELRVAQAGPGAWGAASGRPSPRAAWMVAGVNRGAAGWWCR
jgi:hypothetical protein